MLPMAAVLRRLLGRPARVRVVVSEAQESFPFFNAQGPASAVGVTYGEDVLVLVCGLPPFVCRPTGRFMGSETF